MSDILPAATTGDGPVLDALVVGLGVNGIYQLYRLAEQGLDVRGIDAGDGVGGVWYWNRYPGARFDSESVSYQYFFSPELIDEWDWQEKFAGQPETERYLNHVVDKFGLRGLLSFGQRVRSATYDEDSCTWSVVTGKGDSFRTRYLVLSLGGLSAPTFPDLPGMEDFRGVQHHTSLWPQEPVDFAGKKVAVIGTGPSGVQVVQSVAGEVAELTVFQRSPHWITPLRNETLTDEERAEAKRTADEIHDTCMNKSFAGFVHCLLEESAFDHTPEQRRANYELLYSRAGFGKWLGNYVEVLIDKDMNREFCDFLEEKIRSRVKDPALAEKFIPRDHGYGGKRPPFDNGYYEAFNQDNVHLVDLRETPLVRVTETGLETTEQAYDFDLIVWATGFDALTGSYDRIDITGKNGMKLIDWWGDGPRTVLGLMSPNFPNMFSVAGPHSTGGNVPRAGEVQVDFVADLIAFAHERGAVAVEPSLEAEAAWTQHVMEAAYGANAQPELDYNYGGNVPGKKVVFRGYAGGVPTYAVKCQEFTGNDFEGFEFETADEAAIA